MVRPVGGTRHAARWPEALASGVGYATDMVATAPERRAAVVLPAATVSEGGIPVHQDIINGRPTVQGLSIVDFHLHFRMPHDPLTRSLACGQFGADGGADARSGCEEYDAGQAARSAAVARTSAQWRRSWDFADPESLSADAGWEVEADRWIAELAENGVEHAAFVTAGGNDAMVALVARGAGTFRGMAAMADPFTPGAAQEFENAATRGLRGAETVRAPCFVVDGRSDGGPRVGRRVPPQSPRSDPLRPLRVSGRHRAECVQQVPTNGSDTWRIG
ncbi:hypothetical protein [Pseudarthrobacter sp. Y6]|uniref:hypothetical protein n=1 Tax=Pseudarthrobacter sp. Y6 TaxID=3418422 RepID=UPI003CE7EA0C